MQVVAQAPFGALFSDLEPAIEDRYYSITVASIQDVFAQRKVARFLANVFKDRRYEEISRALTHLPMLLATDLSPAAMDLLQTRLESLGARVVVELAEDIEELELFEDDPDEDGERYRPLPSALRRGFPSPRREVQAHRPTYGVAGWSSPSMVDMTRPTLPVATETTKAAPEPEETELDPTDLQLTSLEPLPLYSTGAFEKPSLEKPSLEKPSLEKATLPGGGVRQSGLHSAPALDPTSWPALASFVPSSPSNETAYVYARTGLRDRVK